MPADIAEHLDPVELGQPFGIVQHDRVGRAGAKAQHLGEHAADTRFIGLDLLDRTQGAGFVLAGGIADHGGAATHQCDRLVAALLQTRQHHHAEEVADVQRRGCAIVADIAVCLTFRGERVEAFEIRTLMNKAAALQHIEKIRFKSSHLCATLSILISRYFRGFAEPWRKRLPGCGALWHYKMCLFDTSWSSKAGSLRAL